MCITFVCLVEIKIEIESSLHCIDIYVDDCTKFQSWSCLSELFEGFSHFHSFLAESPAKPYKKMYSLK